MSHELYYTSAPEGLKRGSSGFCTVAASDNIPRALADRLETLSAYRHHFGVNAGEQPGSGGGAGSGTNPVSFAHWMLSVTGKTYHVLSRICDSGVDHTQRTNAFAHHLVLENSELEAARGGPAWMLQQPGVMAQRWDGQVGSLSRSSLPRADGQEQGGICRAWAAITGDAGWGGHLADLFVKSPTRPVCILFAPGQDLLPLMAESIALLPPATRWNVTFNTYFTSMPTSATCLWRCCLAGTPAAQLGLRYAAAGLVLDLSDPRRLPALPGGPFVSVARTGLVAAPPPAKAAAPAAAPRPAARPASAPPATAAKTSAKSAAPATDDDDEDEVERQRKAFFDAIPESGESDARPSPAEAAPGGGGTYDIAPLKSGEHGGSGGGSAAGTAATGIAHLSGLSRTSARKADQKRQQMEEDAGAASRRRRRQVLWLFGGALAAIAGGSVLVWVAYHKLAPPAADILPPPHQEAPNPEPLTQAPPAPAPTEIPPPLPTPQTPPPPTPILPIPPPPVRVAPAPAYPDEIALTDLLERPRIGNGISDYSQSLTFRAADLDKVPINGVRIRFPSAESSGRPRTITDNLYENEQFGTLAGKPETRGSRPGIAITWKAAGDPGFPAELLYISLDRTRPAVELQWHPSLLLKSPQLLPFAYWVLQSSGLDLQTLRSGSQQIQFKRFAPPALSLEEAADTIHWPVEPPQGAVAVAPRLMSLPHGWEATTYPDWEVKEAALRSPANQSQVVKFKKPTTTAAVDAWFLVIFRPGLGKIESTFARRVAADQADLSRNEGELRSLEQQIEQAKSSNGGTMPESDSATALLARRDASARLVEAYRAAVAAYGELASFDIGIELPDGLRLATLHFQQAPKPNDTGK